MSAGLRHSPACRPGGGDPAPWPCLSSASSHPRWRSAEPLGLTQIVALVFTLAGVVLATRS
jgi:hypothetical protein